MTARTARALRAGLAIGVLPACVPGAAAAASSPPNTVSQWDVPASIGRDLIAIGTADRAVRSSSH